MEDPTRTEVISALILKCAAAVAKGYISKPYIGPLREFAWIDYPKIAIKIYWKCSFKLLDNNILEERHECTKNSKFDADGETTIL